MSHGNTHFESGGEAPQGDRSREDILRRAAEERQVLLAQADTRVATVTDARSFESRETGPERPAWNNDIMLTFDDSLRNAPDIIDYLERQGIDRFRFYAEAATAMRPEALAEMGVVKNARSTKITPGRWLTEYVDPRRGSLTREQFMRRYMIKKSLADETNYLETGRAVRDWFIARYPTNWLEKLEETFGYHAAILHPNPTDERNHIQYWTPDQIREDIETFETFMRAWLNITEFHVRHLRTPAGGGFGYDGQFNRGWQTGTRHAQKLIDTVAAFRPGATWDMWTVNSYDASKKDDFDARGVAQTAIASIEHPKRKAYAPEENLLLLHSNKYDRAHLGNLNALTRELDQAYRRKYLAVPERPHAPPTFEEIHAELDRIPFTERHAFTATDRQNIDAQLATFWGHCSWTSDQYFVVIDEGEQFAALVYYSIQTQKYYLVGDFGVPLSPDSSGILVRGTPEVMHATPGGRFGGFPPSLANIIDTHALLDGKNGRYVFIQDSRETADVSRWGKIIATNAKLWSAAGVALQPLHQGQSVYVLGQRQNGYLVRLQDGSEGFITKTALEFTVPPISPEPPLPEDSNLPQEIQGRQVIYEMGNWPPARLAALINQLKQLPTQEERMMALFHAWKDIRYAKQLPGLRHGYQGYTIEEPYRNKVVVRFDAMDCTEFPIYALAMLGARDVDDFFERLIQIKYRDGIVGDENKIHYTYLRMLNWQSQGLVADVGPTLPPHLIATDARMSTTIANRQERRRQSYTYIPPHRVDQAAPYLRTGDVFGFVLSDRKVKSLGYTPDGVQREQIIGHMGFILVENGRIYFIHSNASRYADGKQAGISIGEYWDSTTRRLKRGTKRPLAVYLEQNSDYKGIVVMRPQLSV